MSLTDHDRQKILDALLGDARGRLRQVLLDPCRRDLDALEPVIEEIVRREKAALQLEVEMLRRT